MKEQILKLRAEGKSYDQIVSLLGCSSATVWYHCNPTAKKERARLNRLKDKLWHKKIKIIFGGKCQSCGYHRCLSALDFHHYNNDKTYSVMNIIRISKGKAIQEAMKCILLCSNCHREVHNKMLDISHLVPNIPTQGLGKSGRPSKLIVMAKTFNP